MRGTRSAFVMVVLCALGCSRPAPPPPHAPPVRNDPPPTDSAQRQVEEPPPGDLGDASCTVDSDCTIGFASSTACCPPDNFCGDVVSRRQVQKATARCANIDCGPPRPSSSCLGVMGTHAACVEGTCARVRDP
jgi:hypothetical protein